MLDTVFLYMVDLKRNKCNSHLFIWISARDLDSVIDRNCLCSESFECSQVDTCPSAGSVSDRQRWGDHLSSGLGPHKHPVRGLIDAVGEVIPFVSLSPDLYGPSGQSLCLWRWSFQLVSFHSPGPFLLATVWAHCLAAPWWAGMSHPMLWRLYWCDWQRTPLEQLEVKHIVLSWACCL